MNALLGSAQAGMVSLGGSDQSRPKYFIVHVVTWRDRQRKWIKPVLLLQKLFS